MVSPALHPISLREEGRFIWWIEPMAHPQMATVATLGLVWIGIGLAALQQIHVRVSYLSRVVESLEWFGV